MDIRIVFNSLGRDYTLSINEDAPFQIVKENLERLYIAGYDIVSAVVFGYGVFIDVELIGIAEKVTYKALSNFLETFLEDPYDTYASVACVLCKGFQRFEGDWEDGYLGHYPSLAVYAQEYLREHCVIDIPDWICVDWEESAIELEKAKVFSSQYLRGEYFLFSN